MKTFFSLWAALALLASYAHAEEPGEDVGADDENKPKIIYKKKTSVSFDDAVVEGTANNPEGVYVVTPPEKQFGSLVKLCPNFHRELMRDSLKLK